MVYEIPINSFTDDTSEPISALNSSSSNKVRVFYNGTGLDDIAGPVPMVDLSKIYNRTDGGLLQSTTNKITINGKIIRTSGIDNVSVLDPAGSGTAVLLQAVSGMHNLFKCDNGTFEIKCGSTSILSGSGVKVLSFNANKSSDNWVYSADYTVDLEFYEPSLAGDNYMIKRGSDSWSLEPTEDYIYSTFDITTKQKAEYHNPNLHNSSSSPSSNTNPSNPTADGGSTVFKVINIPQFKLSRRINAEGIPSTTGSSCDKDNYSAYLNAKKWVQDKLNDAFISSSPSGFPKIASNNLASLSSFQDLFLYNHLRSINFDHLNGSYEVNETWLAMPTGIAYIEDYTIETSTDDRYVRTVRVQGTIKGLSITKISIMNASSGLIPNNSGILSLSDYNTLAESGSYPSRGIDVGVSNINNLYSNKYENASSGWLYDIKPYLYRRASMSANSIDRNRNYIVSNSTPTPVPGNPAYSYERLINIIPISTSETHDPKKGTIGYSYEFNNRLNIISGVISETISVTDTGPVDVINQAFVLGRKLGPVLQNLGARTSANKSVTIDILVPPPSSMDGCLLQSNMCPVYTGGTTYATINRLIEGLKPFGTRDSVIFPNMSRADDTGQVYVTSDNHDWNPTEGRFTRTVSWVYQTCNLSRYYLDH